MRSSIYYSLLVFGIILVLYFSWLASPTLGLSGILPKWIADWADDIENITIRTAVPFVFLSVLIGIQLLLKKASLHWWFVGYIALLFLLFLAELGQLFLPQRNFDWKDIAWGVAASTIGLITMYGIGKLKN